MSNNQRSLGDVTLNDLTRGLKRYQPFVLAVAAIVLVVAFLPGKQQPSSTSTSSGAGANFAPGGVVGGGAQAAGGSGATSGAGSSAGGTFAGGGGGTSAGGGAAGRGGSGSALAAAGSPAGGAAGGAAIPQATSDPHCDPATGRMMIPSLYAPPCMPPFSGDNGGATYQGVTATSIVAAVPYPQFSAATHAILAAAGDNDTQDQVNQTIRDYVDFFEHHVNTYGRKLDLRFFQSNVNPNDAANPAAQNSEAQADAVHIAKELKAFISIGDAGDPAAFYNTLAADHVLCICSTTLPASWYLQRAPYMWGNGLPDETQDYSMRAEVLCDEINPFPPQWVGGSSNPENNLKPPVLTHRVFALMWPEDPSNGYKPGADFFIQRVQEECGLKFKDIVGFQLSDITNPAQAQQEAQTFMAKFSSDGVSTIVFVGDPITPVYFTNAATKQQYFPEWIQTGSALTDTALFARVYDQQQWVHNFGFSALGDRVQQVDQPSYIVYNWQFHKTPPAATGYGPQYSLVFPTVVGISLAGPDLKPVTFQCGEAPFTSKTVEGQPCVGQQYPGLFGYPVSPTSWKSRVTNQVIAFGNKLWPWDDYNQSDDGTLIWWDPNAEGPAENNVQGKGLYRYVFNGARYMYGTFPKGAVPWFNPANTQTVFNSLPAADKPPSYPYACYYLCSSPGS